MLLKGIEHARCNVTDRESLRSPRLVDSEDFAATTTVRNSTDGHESTSPAQDTPGDASVASSPSNAEPDENQLEGDHLSLPFGLMDRFNDEDCHQPTNSSQDELLRTDLEAARDLNCLLTHCLHTSIAQRRAATSQHAWARLRSTLHTDKRAFQTTANSELMRQVHDNQTAPTGLPARNVVEALASNLALIQKLCWLSMAAIFFASTLVDGCPRPDALILFLHCCIAALVVSIPLGLLLGKRQEHEKSRNSGGI